MPIFDPAPFDPVIFDTGVPPPIVCIFDPAIFDPAIFQTYCPVPSMPAQSFSIGGGGGHRRSIESCELEELETFCKLKRLMDGGKSLKQAMEVLDEPEVEEVKEELPKKITPKMEKRPKDPTILAWVTLRIDQIERGINARQAADQDDEDAINFILPHLL